jgi:phytoene dehydrogenase-like protein
MSVADVLGEWFSDERVLITLSRFASELSLAHPQDLNTGLVAYLAPGLTERYGMALPRGGGSAFTRACVRCITDLGGEVRTLVDVRKVITENGRAVGVRTGSGEELRAADAVLASIHPHRLSRFVDGLDPAVARAASRTRLAPYTAFVVHASLDEHLHFKAGAEVDGIVWNTLSASSLGTMNEAFDELRRGRLPAVPLLEAGCPSVADESRAPAGKAVLHMLCLSVHNLADGGPRRWNQLKDSVADALLERLSQFTTNFTRESVRARGLVTPLDHELNTPTFKGGDYTGIASVSHQMGGLRPTKELSQYVVPGVHGLYLTGAFMHPGGGVTGGGRATAIRILEDLQLNRQHVTSEAQPLA